MAGLRDRFPDRLEIGAGINQHPEALRFFYTPAIVARSQQQAFIYGAIFMRRRVSFIHLISSGNEISSRSFPQGFCAIARLCILFCERRVVVLALKFLESSLPRLALVGCQVPFLPCNAC